jgi:serine/threonine protein kinase
MCTTAGGVKLPDFGIAKAMGEVAAERTERGAFKGKHAYMAPERIGTCQPVKRLQDIPECSRPMGCNTQGRCVYMGL